MEKILPLINKEKEKFFVIRLLLIDLLQQLYINSSSNILLITNKYTMIMKSELKNVRDVMNKSIISVDKDDAIRMAVKKMIHGGIGAVIVTEKDKPVGILTERDILKFIANEKMDLDNSKVENIMSAPLISVDSSSSLEEAAGVMLTNNIRRLIIKEKDEYVGIISQRELQRFITELR
jgi:CBS domain-containing protein